MTTHAETMHTKDYSYFHAGISAETTLVMFL